MTDHFEKEFDAFLEKKEYDDVQEALFQLVRAAFLAGWQAAKKGKMMKNRTHHPNGWFFLWETICTFLACQEKYETPSSASLRSAPSPRGR